MKHNVKEYLLKMSEKEWFLLAQSLLFISVKTKGGNDDEAKNWFSRLSGF